MWSITFSWLVLKILVILTAKRNLCVGYVDVDTIVNTNRYKSRVLRRQGMNLQKSKGLGTCRILREDRR